MELKGELLADLNRHNQTVLSAAFSLDGNYILTRSRDNTAKLWNLKGELLADLDKHTLQVNSVVFSPDGKYLLTSSQDHTAKLWPTPQTILEWLKTKPFQELTKEEKAQFHIED